jgi:hypothetical protein
MTTFTMQDLNNIPVTKEEEEAMDALSKLGAGVPFGYIGEGKTAVFDAPQVSAESLHKPNIDEIINAISAQLQLLATVIREGQGNSHAEKSLQECVSTTLQQAEWFKEVVEEKIDDMDFDYQIESAVETYFSNSFCLDDHVDITAEVESKVEDIAEDLLKDIVEERLAEIVSNKLQNLRITFD